jgi:hypothetical protein
MERKSRKAVTGGILLGFFTLIAVLRGGARLLTYAATFTVDQTDDVVNK